jgi:hypothetical protein
MGTGGVHGQRGFSFSGAFKTYTTSWEGRSRRSPPSNELNGERHGQFPTRWGWSGTSPGELHEPQTFPTSSLPHLDILNCPSYCSLTRVIEYFFFTTLLVLFVYQLYLLFSLIFLHFVLILLFVLYFRYEVSLKRFMCWNLDSQLVVPLRGNQIMSINFVNGLIHWWVHSWMGYYEMGSRWRK